MDDSFGVRGIERVGNFDSELEHLVERECAALDPMLQRLTVQIFHHDERMPADRFARLKRDLANLVDRADIRMVQRGCSASLAAEALKSGRVANHAIREKFERHEAAEFGVLGLVHDAHPAAAQLLDDAVVRDGSADQWKKLLRARPY